MKRRSSSTVDLAPLRIVRPRVDDAEAKLRLRAVGSTSAFKLPDDWVVEEKPRSFSTSNPGRIDKYYTELSTGKKFRSVPEVERYLKDKIGISTPKRVRQEPQRKSHKTYDCCIEPETRKKSRSATAVKRYLIEAGNESVTEIRTPRSTTCSPNFVLPDDWVVKKHRRRFENSNKVDKYYIEPETGQEFRSLASVERYLNERQENEFTMRLNDFKRPNKHHVSRRSEFKSTTVPEDGLPTSSEENTTMPKEVAPDNDSGPLMHYDTPKKNDNVVETEVPKDNLGTPPSTINWVLAGPTGDTWNPYHGAFMFPESAKQKWSETFISSIHDDK